MNGIQGAVSNALAGIQSAQNLALQASSRISSGDSDDLVEDIVDLDRARISQAANMTVLKTLDEMQKTALDILA